MVPHTRTGRIRALNPRARGTLRDMGVVFDFQLASLDLRELEIPAEDLAAVRDAMCHSSPAPGDGWNVEASTTTPGVVETVVQDVAVSAPENGDGEDQPQATCHVAAHSDGTGPQGGDPVEDDGTGGQAGSDVPCGSDQAPASSFSSALPRPDHGSPLDMKGRDRNATDAARFLMYESELRCVAANSVEWGGLETCGDMYGLWTHRRRAVVMLVVGPGPGAVHQPAHCVQDIDFFRRNTEFLYTHFGLQYIGPWHSHGEMELGRPSGPDAEQIRSISRRNGFSHLVEIITTLRAAERGHVSSPLRVNGSGDAPGASWKPWFMRRCRSHSRTDMHVKINAFEHTDPQSGQGRRCSIKVLPGISPVRLALVRNHPHVHAALNCQAPDFPMERVLFDSLDESSTDIPDDAREAAVPEELVEQCEHLPSMVLDKMIVTVREGLILFELPIASGATVLVAYETKAPHEPTAVGFKPDAHSELIDATAYALADGTFLRLDQIHAKMASFDPGHGKLAVETRLPVANAAMSTDGAVSEPTENPAEPKSDPVPSKEGDS